MTTTMTMMITKTKMVISKLRKSLSKSLILTAWFALNPVPASRPRVTRWGTYYSKTYKNWMTEAEQFVPTADEIIDRPVIVLQEHIVKKARTSKLILPNGDVDNYAKASLDALTKGKTVWTDDKIVKGLFTYKRFAEEAEEPGTLVQIYEGD